MVLLRGLSPNSATVTATVATTQFGKKREPVTEVVGAKAAQSAFDALYKPRPSPR